MKLKKKEDIICICGIPYEETEEHVSHHAKYVHERINAIPKKILQRYEKTK